MHGGDEWARLQIDRITKARDSLHDQLSERIENQ